MNKRGLGFTMAVLFALALCCVPLAAIVGDVSGAWSAYVTRLQTDKALAEAAAFDARASLVVAQGEAAILQEAARSVAADRRLVTLYAASSNAVVLLAVALGGLVAGVLVGRRGGREEVRRVG